MNWKLIRSLLNRYPNPCVLMRHSIDGSNTWPIWELRTGDYKLPTAWVPTKPDSSWKQTYLVFLGPFPTGIGVTVQPDRSGICTFPYTYFQVQNAS